MNYTKYKLFAGILSLIINIILPTFIYNCYNQQIGTCDKTVIYSLIAILLLLWLSTLFIALRELGGLLLHSIKPISDLN